MLSFASITVLMIELSIVKSKKLTEFEMKFYCKWAWLCSDFSNFYTVRNTLAKLE